MSSVNTTPDQQSGSNPKTSAKWTVMVFMGAATIEGEVDGRMIRIGVVSSVIFVVVAATIHLVIARVL